MDTFDIIVGVIGLLALAASSFVYWWLLFGRQIQRERPPALELMRRLYGADDRLMTSALRRITLKAAGERLADKPIDLLKTVRARIEFDICHRYFAERRDSDRIWREGAEKVFCHQSASESERPCIPLENCSVMHEDAFVKPINLYFYGLNKLGEAPEFISDVEIGDGFVAPLQLLTGLLHYSQEDWKKIIDEFGEDAQDHGNLLSAGLRKFQAFIYDCWLLWGPSIPICSNECDEWASGGLSSLQFGYGDENNSIVLIGEKNALKAYAEPISERSVLAYRANVKGRLKRGLDISKKDRGAFGRALQQTIKTEGERWLVLDLRDRGSIMPIEKSSSGKGGVPYYSAYLWVLVVILGTDDQNGDRPIHEFYADKDPRRWREWTSFIPFFEHGNVADLETYSFLRRQLAAKAVAAIYHIGRATRVAKRKLRFAYACAIDDSGCGNELAHPMKNAGPSIKDIMTAKAAEIEVAKAAEIKAAETAPNAERSSARKKKPILDFAMYPKGDSPFSSCKLPSILWEYYRDLDLRNKDREENQLTDASAKKRT